MDHRNKKTCPNLTNLKAKTSEELKALLAKVSGAPVWRSLPMYLRRGVTVALLSALSVRYHAGA